MLARERISQTVDAVVATSSRFLETDALKTEKQVFDARLQTNRQRLEQKAREPSQSITLEPLKDILQKMKDLIEKANGLIRDHNTIVENLASAQTQLIADVWAFFAHSEITVEFAKYQRDKKGVDAAIGSLEQQIATATSEQKAKDAELRDLEKQTTSVRPTVDEINKLLNAFGFRSFRWKVEGPEVHHQPDQNVLRLAVVGNPRRQPASAGSPECHAAHSGTLLPHSRWNRI